MHRRLVAFCAFVLAFVAAGRASAAVVRDGDKYSVALDGARICWVVPVDLRTDDACEGLTPDNVPVPSSEKSRVVAMGLVRLEPPGHPADLALVMVMHVPVPVVHEADEQVARDYARGARQAIVKQLPAGARLRAGEDARIVRPGKIPLIRAVFDVDGLPENADDKLIEHQIHVSGMADDGMYSVAWLSRRRSARRIEALADASAPSMTITNRAMGAREFKQIVGIVVLAVFGGGAMLVGLVLVIALRPKKKYMMPAYPAPYAYPFAAPPPMQPPPMAPPARPYQRAWWE